VTADVSPEQGLLFDLSSRTKLRMSGVDRVRFLNGQISNDVRKARPDIAIHACVLNAKGKINADVMIVADGESFLIDADPALREELATRLDRYIIADDVEIEDVSDSFALFHVSGASAPAFAGANVTAKAERFGTSGTDLWLGREQHALALQELSMSLPTCDGDCAEVLRIERGIPRWGHELTDEIIPTEANLEARAIDYAKGCYIGQEVISRIKMSGQTNKRLCGLLPVDGAAPTAGMRLMSAAKDVGWITSVAQSNRLGRTIALGFVKRGFQEPGTQLELQMADGTVTPVMHVELVTLPFV
jgi:folate-binding protein YgfZ